MHNCVCVSVYGLCQVHDYFISSTFKQKYETEDRAKETLIQRERGIACSNDEIVSFFFFNFIVES